VAAAKAKAPWMTKRWMSTSTKMAMPGIINACSLQPRRPPAPRNSRRAIRAAQPRLHASPILQRPPCSTSSSYPPPCSVAACIANSEPHAGARPSVRLCVGAGLACCVHKARWCGRVARRCRRSTRRRHRCCACRTTPPKTRRTTLPWRWESWKEAKESRSPFGLAEPWPPWSLARQRR
jgi:hypothetical protein